MQARVRQNMNAGKLHMSRTTVRLFKQTFTQVTITNRKRKTNIGKIYVFKPFRFVNCFAFCKFASLIHAFQHVDKGSVVQLSLSNFRKISAQTPELYFVLTHGALISGPTWLTITRAVHVITRNSVAVVTLTEQLTPKSIGPG